MNMLTHTPRPDRQRTSREQSRAFATELLVADNDSVASDGRQRSAGEPLASSIQRIARCAQAVQIQLAAGELSQASETLRVLQAAAGTALCALSEAGRGGAAASLLTERELEVLRLVARGGSNQEIASALGIGEGTVRRHVSVILGKLRLASRTQAALYALREGIATLDEAGQAAAVRPAALR